MFTYGTKWSKGWKFSKQDANINIYTAKILLLSQANSLSFSHSSLQLPEILRGKGTCLKLHIKHKIWRSTQGFQRSKTLKLSSWLNQHLLSARQFCSECQTLKIFLPYKKILLGIHHSKEWSWAPRVLMRADNAPSALLRHLC